MVRLPGMYFPVVPVSTTGDIYQSAVPDCNALFVNHNHSLSTKHFGAKELSEIWLRDPGIAGYCCFRDARFEVDEMLL